MNSNKIRIYYEDTDAGGVVYHSNYLKYCERARSDYFFSKDLSPIVNDSHFVVRKMNCNFIYPAKFGDLINVTTEIVEINRASFSLFHKITKDYKILFEATVLLVLVKDGKVKRIDKDMKKLLESLYKV